MKYLLIAIPGAADQPAEPLGDKTPLELAKIPHLQHFAKVGKVGQIKLMSDHLDPSSDISFLNLLGYDADQTYTGRGPLEAASLDLNLDENEIAFRMNFITEADGKMADSTSGHISTKEARALINFLNKRVASDFVRFFPGSGYRHVAVLKDSQGYEALSARTLAPDAIVGKRLDEHFPKGPGEELLKKLMFDTKLLLQDHEINQVRLDLKENPANMIWLWGQGKMPSLEPFQKRHNVSGAVFAGMEYAKGTARLAGMLAVDTGVLYEETDKDYETIAGLAVDALKEKDFVCVHLNGCDEASRLGDSRAKISALEGMDFFFLSKIKKYLDHNKDTRLMIHTVHASPWQLRRHTRDWAPFVIAGKNVMADDIEKFSEVTARVSELKFKKGSEGMNFLFS